MMINVVVAAECRKAGKTLLASALVSELVRLGLRVSAFKLCLKPGEPSSTETGAGRAGSDTWRLMNAGAFRTALVISPDRTGIAHALRELPQGEDVCIWESNTAAGLIRPDCLAYIGVAGCGDPKDPALEALADIVASGPLTEESATRFAKRAAASLESRLPGKERPE